MKKTCKRRVIVSTNITRAGRIYYRHDVQVKFIGMWFTVKSFYNPRPRYRLTKNGGCQPIDNDKWDGSF